MADSAASSKVSAARRASRQPFNDNDLKENQKDSRCASGQPFNDNDLKELFGLLFGTSGH